MDQSELVIDIVFSLDTTFEYLTIEECCNIFHIFPAYRYLKANKNIRQSFNKYLTIYIYNKLCDHLMKTYYKCYLGYEHKKQYIFQNEPTIKAILQQIPNPEIKDAFERLLIAEYKEMVFLNRVDDSYISYELRVLEAFVDYYYPVPDDYDNDFYLDIVYNHRHDPEHYMFKNDINYSFYKFEKAGNNLFD